MSFPTIVYRSPGLFVGPPVNGKSTTYASLGCANRADLDDALAAGWFMTLPAALALPSHAVPVEPEPDLEPAVDVPVPSLDKDTLRARARELGITVDGRWSVDRLVSEIAAAEAT